MMNRVTLICGPVRRVQEAFEVYSQRNGGFLHTVNTVYAVHMDIYIYIYKTSII